jgi:hypothetical protein
MTATRCAFGEVRRQQMTLLLFVMKGRVISQQQQKKNAPDKLRVICALMLSLLLAHGHATDKQERVQHTKKNSATPRSTRKSISSSRYCTYNG